MTFLVYFLRANRHTSGWVFTGVEPAGLGWVMLSFSGCCLFCWFTAAYQTTPRFSGLKQPPLCTCFVGHELRQCWQGGSSLPVALTRSLGFGRHVVWRVPGDFTHTSGASVGASARPGKVATAGILAEASPAWHSQGPECPERQLAPPSQHPR